MVDDYNFNSIIAESIKKEDAELVRKNRSDGKFRFGLGLITALAMLISRVVMQGYPEGIYLLIPIIMLIVFVIYVASGAIKKAMQCRAMKKYNSLAEPEAHAGAKLANQAITRYRLISVGFAILLFLAHLPIWQYVDPQIFPLESRYSSTSESEKMDDIMEGAQVDSANSSTSDSPQPEKRREEPNPASEEAGARLTILPDESSKVPESELWTTATERVGQVEAIAGPVTSVQWSNSSKTPTYVNIGRDYPDPCRAQIIIWPEDMPEYEEMLSSIDDGGWWIRVVGYIKEYEGIPEIELSDACVTYNYWYEGQ